MSPTDEKVIYSALKEIVNIGGGNAATSLSKLISKQVKMAVPRLKLMEYEEVFQSVISDDQEVKVILMQLLGGEGSFIFVVSPDSAWRFAELMIEGEMEITPELADSAVKELVNILVNTFLNASMQVIDLKLVASIPLMIHDLFGSILSWIYLEHGQYDSRIIIIQNEFWSEGEKIEGSLFFVPRPEFQESLIGKI